MKVFTGEVISKKMDKTATVVVERVMVHPVYKKRIKRVKKYHIHDTLGSEVGQTVKFVASKPYSKLKKWKIIEILNKSTASRNRKSKKKTVVNIK
jgi:small subunit ribosomal protein S17